MSIAKSDALSEIDAEKTTVINTIDSKVSLAQDAADTATAKATSATNSEKVATTKASEASTSASLAKTSDKADQTIATKGWIWFDDADDSGYLTMYVADSIADNVTARDDGNGCLEVILS